MTCLHFLKVTTKLNEYLSAGDFPRESQVVPPAVKTWVKSIPAQTELTKMALAGFTANTWDVHPEEIHLLQVFHFLIVLCPSLVLLF